MDSWILFPNTGKHIPSNISQTSNINLKFPYSTAETSPPTKWGMVMQQSSVRKFEDLSKYIKGKSVTKYKKPNPPT